MTPPLTDPRAWLAAARGGSREALGQILEASRAYLLAIANGDLDPVLRGKGGASDLVQETFLQAQKDIGRFQGNSQEEFRAWLRSLLHHRLANFTRRYRQTLKRGGHPERALGGAGTPAQPGQGASSPVPSPSALLMARERAEAVRRSLERLPEDYRRVLHLRYQDELSFQEIGRVLNRSAEAARKLWWRALGQLQDALEPHA